VDEYSWPQQAPSTSKLELSRRMSVAEACHPQQTAQTTKHSKNSTDWGDYTPRTLKAPIHEALATEREVRKKIPP